MAASRAKPLPFEVHGKPGRLLGMPPRAFLRDYWQKRPLLIRGAFPGYTSPVEPDDLAGLACEDGVLARLIQHDRASDGWTVRSGPFPEELFPGLGDRDWTLLVQDMDKWDPDIAALVDAFDFLPRWRIDDVMVSFAATGGSVGAHVDQYDVFLLQAQGHRRWQIDAGDAMGHGVPAMAFRDDVELKLLREFVPTHDWVLAPGDMLYLPPNVPHNGVAEDPCLTFSLGMRAPATAELMGDYIDTLAAEADESLRYTDPDLAPPRDANEIDATAMGRVVEALNAIRMADADALGDWFGRFITTYRSAAGPGLPESPARSRIEVEWDLQQGAVLVRHPWTRVAWRRARRGASLYIAGHCHALPVRDAQRLSAAAVLDATTYAALSEAARDCVMALVTEGHYRLDMDDDGDTP
ncbi:cupin domain-containing protein [Luteimonas sp. MC1572]|uniref:ribosomal protein uL16 3-hydroxylase n=1 Tax=Luteimonas sp. MC1572 TaxID=2799325 RepID=UPI0018F0630C|nr:cupin domain-containing protein [Luteimonas sp. MC1572]MBJ6980686.1 cupin domain-containing protein [Luteimonas sp. MC1572]QQO02061.1 cupin domain-containing protein [Luteimonas sp. MC1572]